MLAKLRINLLLAVAVGMLAACGPAVPVDVATPSAPVVTDLPPTPEATAESQPSPLPAGFDCQDIQDIPAEECQALVALYESTNGDAWADNSGWLVSQTPCSWAGVICEQGHVAELQLFYNQLSGSLPGEIGDLTHLRSLYLDRNQLSGPVPAEIGQLTALRVARLPGNQFNSIPAELFSLDRLNELDLSSNQLSGAIPGEIGNLSLLQWLNLSANEFTGSIPPELGNLTNLNSLYLSHNQLSGSIPATLGELVNLNELVLSHNQLSGPIPGELGNLKNAYLLDLSYNQLTGDVPAALASTPIWDVRLWGNQLDGTILITKETTAVDYGGVQFAINSALAESVWPEMATARPTSPGGPGWNVWPEHLRFSMAGPREQSDLADLRVGIAAYPQIMIYPAQEYGAMSEPAKAQIEALQSLLESRPPAIENEIPLLPLINAAQVFHAQVEYLDFQNGSGVRFITQYSQDISPITNKTLFYAFQGLTEDGAYYVSAFFPLRAPGLTDEPMVEDWDAFSAGYQGYLEEAVRQLDALSAEEFEPDLELLDQVVQSLRVNTP